MIKLAPSILSADFARLLEDVKKVEKAGCEYLHIDVMDGHFVPNITLGPGIVKSLRKDVNMVFDAHLMIENPDNYIKEFADAGCDIMCVNLVDRTAPGKIIKLARQNNIPIIFFNREPVREDLMQWDKLYYVGCAAEQSGVMQGEIVADYLAKHPDVDKNKDGKIQYVLLEGEAGHQDAISRTDCSVKTIIQNGIDLEKLSYQFADWNRGQAENRVTQLISQYKNRIELIISNNDEMALGAVAAYKKSGYGKKEMPIIFGIDGLEDALEAIKNGKMQGTVYNDKEDQAMEIAKLVVDVFKGNSLQGHNLNQGKYYVSQYKKVDIDSVDSFIGR